MEENEPYESSSEMKTNGLRRWLVWLVVGLIGILVVLLAAFAGSRLLGDRPSTVPDEAEVAVMRETLTPTATPTPLPTATITPTPPGSTPVPVEAAAGWTFEGVRLQPDPHLGGLLIYGEAINNTGSPQRILGVLGTYYDVDGALVIPEEISDYWPIETVSPGWRMPFELTLIGPVALDRVALQVNGEVSDNPLRTDFELSQLEGVQGDDEYCVIGRVRNPGQALDSYLMAVAVLYDDDDRVINWGIGYQPVPENLVGDETVMASGCAEHYGNVVARYDLRAWGE
jgi:hypothetical protein